MEYIVDTQITAANVNDLKRYTTEQLKAEIRRRIEAAKAERANIERCRNCVHMVRIAYTSVWGGKTAETIGFFNGFVAGACYPAMQMFKVRKDGTKSRNEFTSWYLPGFNDPFTIEIVE